MRKRVRDEINQALAKSEDARAKRDTLCLYIAQHRMTGTEQDISQYISLALYLTPPPELETTADLTEMPPDSTQVAEIVPLLRDFAAAVDLHGIWLTDAPYLRRGGRPAARSAVADDRQHQSLSQDAGRQPTTAPVHRGDRAACSRRHGERAHLWHGLRGGGFAGQRQDPHGDVRHTYLHYVIEPLLYARANAIDRDAADSEGDSRAPLDFRYRSDTVALTVECLIKAIEARTMDTGIPEYKIPAGVDRSRAAALRARARAVTSRRWMRCAGPRCSTT